MSVVTRHARRRRMDYNINLTPLLDVILNLVFFFVLATTLRQTQSATELKVTLPLAAHGEATQEKATPKIIVDTQGAVWYEGKTMPLEELALYLYKLGKQGQKSIDIDGDEGVSYGRMVEVWDTCKAAGLDEAHMQMRGKDAGTPAQ